jgi:anti-sigma regulatory factor (Ser/Thr protein kinase)
MIPNDETARLAALRRYRILDTEPEQRFDDLTTLASQVCGAPIALITLVDDRRQWFKSRVGTTLNETSRSISFCAHAMGQRELLIIPDARKDDRFRDNPMVTGEPNIRFYAGAPLASRDGHPLGSLCVMDRAARTLTDDQAAALQALRRQVEAQLELRRSLMELEAALAERDRAEEAQHRLIGDLRAALDNVSKLSGLIPLSAACRFNMVIPADPAAISTITGGVERVLEEKGWSKEDVIPVELAVREALANAIRHGCGNDPKKAIQCCVTYEASGEIAIVIRDPGPGFEAAALPDPMAPQNLFKSSGRGVYLINHLMDAVRFRDCGREVEMRKRRGPAAQGES